VTLKWRDGNRRVHLSRAGAFGSSFKLDAGGRPMLMFKGKGLHTDVSTAGAVLAHADADFTGWNDAKPVASGTTTFTYGGVSGLGIRELPSTSRQRPLPGRARAGERRAGRRAEVHRQAEDHHAAALGR
jgi:hypothetical protein